MENNVKKTYRIYTNYMWNFYRIDEDGNVLETNRGKISDDGIKTWRITGAWYSGAFGNTYNISLKQLLTADRLLYKNRQPIYGLTDIDHGTSRLHGNKSVHGVRLIVAE